MKKLFAWVICAVSALSVYAEVTVTQNGKTVTYKSGSTLTVNGKNDAAINYDGVSVFIPKGQMLIIRPGKTGGIVLQGEQMAGIVVNNRTLSSEGFASLSVDPKTQAITVQEGSVNVADKTGNLQTYEQGSVLVAQTVAPAQETTVRPAPAPAKPVTYVETATEALPDFVAFEALDNNVAYEQATQDVERALSPSAPRE